MKNQKFKVLGSAMKSIREAVQHSHNGVQGANHALEDETKLEACRTPSGGGEQVWVLGVQQAELVEIDKT